jgi:2-polyprenyl-3-methyl-5-hydroxy-6-metoxy-1,4-benzoquinol methylase
MKLKDTYLKKKYLKFFNYNQFKYNFVVTDLKFGYSEIYNVLKSRKYKNILEIGSGTGLLLNELQKSCPKFFFVGIDPGESGFHNYKQILLKIEKLNKKTKFYKKNIINYKTQKKFDLIFSFNVFEHIKNQKKFLKKTYSLLNKNGKIIIYAPNYDFPYEPHFVLPIIFNKKLTKIFFKKKILSHELKTKEKGLWQGLNLTGVTKIKKFLKDNNMDYFFDSKIKNVMINRIFTDKTFYKRQGLAAKITKLAFRIGLDKLFFDFLKIPFPYFKLIIKKTK